MNHFSHNLKSWRLFRNLTQEQLSLKSGIPRPNLVAIEQGRRECTLTTLARLASALGVSPGSLLDRLPPGRSSWSLNRHQIDRIARNILAQKGKLPKAHFKIRDQALYEAGPLLRVGGIRVRKSSKGQDSLHHESVQQVLGRISKLLPSVLSGVSL